MTQSSSPALSPSLLEAADLSPEAARSILSGAMTGADDGELFLERAETESLVFDDGRLKAASYDAHEGFGLRVVSDETAGYAHSSVVDAAAIARAAETASLATQGRTGVQAEAPVSTNQQLYAPIDPLASPAFSDKIALLSEIDAWARTRDPRVVQVSVSMAGEHRDI
ncbi:MAG TPA: metalloprotease TldD, partial [Brevundimonas sp.]|nr:metalloprotease TldD [Brevundimonas sp.]